MPRGIFWNDVVVAVAVVVKCHRHPWPGETWFTRAVQMQTQDNTRVNYGNEKANTSACADGRNGKIFLRLRLHFTRRVNRATQTEIQTQGKYVNPARHFEKKNLNRACVSYFPCACVRLVNVVFICACPVRLICCRTCEPGLTSFGTVKSCNRVVVRISGSLAFTCPLHFNQMQCPRKTIYPNDGRQM